MKTLITKMLLSITLLHATSALPLGRDPNPPPVINKMLPARSSAAAGTEDKADHGQILDGVGGGAGGTKAWPPPLHLPAPDRRWDPGELCLPPGECHEHRPWKRDAARYMGPDGVPMEEKREPARYMGPDGVPMEERDPTTA